MRARCWIVILALAAGASACTRTPAAANVFTPAHTSTASAVRDFFLIRPAAEQPIPFPHKTHIEKAMLKCTETCHEAVVKGPSAGIPASRPA